MWVRVQVRVRLRLRVRVRVRVCAEHLVLARRVDDRRLLPRALPEVGVRVRTLCVAWHDVLRHGTAWHGAVRRKPRATPLSNVGGAHLEGGDLLEDGLGDGLELVEDRSSQEGAPVLITVLSEHDQHVAVRDIVHQDLNRSRVRLRLRTRFESSLARRQQRAAGCAGARGAGGAGSTGEQPRGSSPEHFVQIGAPPTRRSQPLSVEETAEPSSRFIQVHSPRSTNKSNE